MTISIYSLFIISIALALDAFGVSLSIGLSKNLRYKNKALFCISFGFFQFMLAYIGSYLGALFNRYILTIPDVIGGIVIFMVGILMLKDGIKNDNTNVNINKKMYFILGISVSIDAAVVGFTVLNNISSKVLLLESTLFIGVITSILCLIAFLISGYLKKITIVSKYANYIGGIMLMIFGLKMMFA
ncbi:integral membrane protein [Clostridium botulinum C str. Eklund]|nr:integral membrane protein [Clostridium botulinum C str. Eklund]NEZ48065.1 hypothetical protein [Clostridium botulinum]